MTLAEARLESSKMQLQLQQSEDPLAIRAIETIPENQNVYQLFQDWYAKDLRLRLKHPNIPKRVFTKKNAPFIGQLPIQAVRPTHVRAVLERVRESNRPAIANDTLMYMKQLFRHAIKLDLTLNNPAAAFTANDAGGVEYSGIIFL